MKSCLMTKVFVVLIVLLFSFLLGCSNNTVSDSSDDLNFKIVNVSSGEAFLSDDDKVLDVMIIELENYEVFNLSCTIKVSLLNSTNSSVVEKVVDISSGKTNVSIAYEMLSGDGDISIVPSCSKFENNIV